jgi:putative ABC transport system permease protein
MGIRIALGGTRRDILKLVLSEGIVLVCAGIGFGFAAVIAMRPVLHSQLYGVGSLNPIVITTVVLVLSTIAFVACILPAQRATRVDPVLVLSQQ